MDSPATEQHPRAADPTPGHAATTTDTLAYPISPDYVKSWTPVRALCELIANALDEDKAASVAWTDGVLTISDNGPGIAEEGLVLGHSTKDHSQIGQFGEGKKLACLVLARSDEVGEVRCETVGYGFTPHVERRRLLNGLVPSRSQQGAEMLVYRLHRNNRTTGTVFTIACTEQLAAQAISRFRALAEPDYQPPQTPGACILDGEPGRIWIGGVLVTRMPGLLVSYDLPLDSKGLQNRDRTVIEAGALRDSVQTILAVSEDPGVVDRFARHVLDGGKLREPEQFFCHMSGRSPRAKAAWRAWGRAHLPERSFFTISGNEEAKLDLIDKGYTEVTAAGLPHHLLFALMDRLGVELARTRQVHHYERTSGKTTWVADKSLTADERAVLTGARQLICRAIGPFAIDRIRVYSKSETSPCSDGFYSPVTGDIAIHRSILTQRPRTLHVLLHEAAHRVAHRGGGRWLPIPDYTDRTRGFETMLCDFGALLLGYLADGTALPELAVDPSPAPAPRQRRTAAADDPAVPAVRRELAHLLNDQLPQALTAGRFTSEKDMVASTGVHLDYWHTLTRPKTIGYRQQRGGRAWDYDKVALLAEAAGLHPPVVWLGYHLCEGPLHHRPREQWGQSDGPWTKKMREATLRACAELQAIGGAYAEHVPALRALAEGRTPAPLGDDGWHAPARALLALERSRLGLDAVPAPSRPPGPGQTPQTDPAFLSR
ncbi:hypothetical protein [Actinoplanes sp. NPDC020271]|uniref:hypothetical protein n=1 Tax=Actinoplanes sp. NPDC020271 TaxID=3363896 RepID=UPI003796ECBD